MKLDIGLYVNKEDRNEVGLVFAVIRTILHKNESGIFARKVSIDYNEDYFFDMEPDSGNCQHYKGLLDYFSFSNYKGKMKYDDVSVFSGSNFINFYSPIKIISSEKIIDVGEIYSNSSGDKVFVLGIVRTNINENKHTVIVRKMTSDKFNKSISFDHDQMGSTPDYYNTLFYEREQFLKNYNKIKI